MRRPPDFIIIGAMKCATSTLQKQLANQPGIFMTEPKEPYFFSNDEVYAKGIEWYQSLFDPAGPDTLCGEASTHYTKLPTYPCTVERMRKHVPHAKLIYVMRHPIDRLVSQYIHEWTMRFISAPINQAIDAHPELVDYSRYAMQLEPFLETYGRDHVLPVFFDRLRTEPQEELVRVCQFIGYPSSPEWDGDLGAQNVSRDRLRRSPVRDTIVYAPVISAVRKRLIPKCVRDQVKKLWQLRKRPALTPANVERLRAVFDEDLSKLGAWLGVELTTENFVHVTAENPLEWLTTATNCPP